MRLRIITNQDRFTFVAGVLFATFSVISLVLHNPAIDLPILLIIFGGGLFFILNSMSLVRYWMCPVLGGGGVLVVCLLINAPSWVLIAAWPLGALTIHIATMLIVNRMVRKLEAKFGD